MNLFLKIIRFGNQPRRQYPLSVYLDIILWSGGLFKVRACVISFSFFFFFVWCCCPFKLFLWQYRPSKAHTFLPKCSIASTFLCRSILSHYSFFFLLSSALTCVILWWNCFLTGTNLRYFYVLVVFDCFVVSIGWLNV